MSPECNTIKIYFFKPCPISLTGGGAAGGRVCSSTSDDKSSKSRRMNPAAGSPATGLHVDLGSGDRRGLRTQTHQSVVVTKQGGTHSYTVNGGVSDGVFLGIGHVNESGM